MLLCNAPKTDFQEDHALIEGFRVWPAATLPKCAACPQHSCAEGARVAHGDLKSGNPGMKAQQIEVLPLRFFARFPGQASSS